MVAIYGQMAVCGQSKYAHIRSTWPGSYSLDYPQTEEFAIPIPNRESRTRPNAAFPMGRVSERPT